MTAQPADPVRVVIVDDQTLVREGFAVLLDRVPGIRVLGTAGDGLTALRVIAETGPDVALVDLRMPGLDGVETTRRIRRAHPGVAVLLLTTYLHESAVLAALRAGALGAVGKDAAAEEVAAAIHAVREGTPVLPGSTQRALLGRPRTSPPGNTTTTMSEPTDPALSPREIEIARLIAEGLTNPQIATRLGISTPTVKTHLNNLFAKLNARDRPTAIAAALARGLLG